MIPLLNAPGFDDWRPVHASAAAKSIARQYNISKITVGAVATVSTLVGPH
jgi:hypothetical protein